MLELYTETHYEIFDPHDARQVAVFFAAADAQAYLEWRNGQGADQGSETEAEWLGNKDQDPGLVGTGLMVGENGELAIVHADGCMDKWEAFRTSDTEARNLAALIDAVLA